MELKPIIKSVGSSTIESFLWAIESYLMGKYGVDTAQKDIAPLQWYIYTGRASVHYLGYLVMCKPYMIARKLHERGSYVDALERIKNYMVNHVGYTESEA